VPSRGTAVIEQVGDLIKRRLEELEEESDRLKRGLAELDGGGKVRRSRSKVPRAQKVTTTKESRRKPRRGRRTDQAVALIEKTPGLSAPEIADKVGIRKNYMYQVLKTLAKEGRIKKQGRQYFPAP
jgi:sugar-specific transcriptional regulator TrmB